MVTLPKPLFWQAFKNEEIDNDLNFNYNDYNYDGENYDYDNDFDEFINLEDSSNNQEFYV